MTLDLNNMTKILIKNKKTRININDKKASRTTKASATMSSSSSWSLSSSPSSSLSSFLNPVNFCILLMLFGCCMPIALVNSFDIQFEEQLNFKPTKYSAFNKNGTYISDMSYNSGGMQPLYEITHIVIGYIIGRDPLPDGYIEVENNDLVFGPKVERNQWGELILHNWPILLITICLALLIVLMPIIGLCFCCCRCAGNCGGRSEPFDKKHDTCRRFCYGFLLIILVIGILFGVIVAFVTNSFMQTGLERGTTTARQGSADTQEFLKHTGQQLDHVLVTNYKELYKNLENILNETGLFLNSRLEQKSMAVSFKYLADFLAKMPEKKELLEQMRSETDELQRAALQLRNGLNGVKRDLLTMLNKCKEVKACEDVLQQYEIDNLDYVDGVQQYDRLPNVTHIISAMDELIAKDIAAAGKRGRVKLENLSRHLNDTIAEYIPQILNSLREAGERFRKSSNEVQQKLNSVAATIDKTTKRSCDVADGYLHEYAPYRFYAGIAVCSTLLLILICLIVALCCGICGKRPGGYGDDCCNKGAGSRFLIMAITLIFLTLSAILLFAYLHFLVGITGHSVVCEPLKDPQEGHTGGLFALIDRGIDLNRYLNDSLGSNNNANGGNRHNAAATFRISEVIANCKANQTLYDVLHIEQRFNISKIKDYSTQFKLNQTLDNLVKSVDLPEQTIVILDAKDKQRILELAKSPLKDFDSTKFIDNLHKETITKHSLLELAKQLRETVTKITALDVQGSLRNQAIHLEAYERELVIPIKNHIAKLKRLTQQLDKMMRYKERSFEESLPMLINEIERAQQFLNQEGRGYVKKAAHNLTRYFNDEIDNYLTMVNDSVKKEIGLCQPLAHVYDATYVGLCKRIIDPLNGYWAGVIWCALLFLPTLCVAVKLAALYQKSDPYPGPLVESEYLYDAYSEQREAHTLQNRPKNKRNANKHHKDNRRAGGHRAEYYDEPLDNMAASQAMAAPKHWVDPAVAGPPRYQNPPMAPPASEYERPPPYYYPGAAEQE